METFSLRTPRYNTIIVSSNIDGVLRLTISNGTKNLWDWKLTEDLAEVLDALNDNKQVKVVIFSSDKSDVFIAHYDLGPVGPDAPSAHIQQEKLFGHILFKIRRSPIVFIAELAGAARGIGSEFALYCDMRFAARGKAILGQPEVRVGIVPGVGGIEYLVQFLGRGRALQYILTGDDVDADKAERIGWVNQVFDPSEITRKVDGIARKIARSSPDVLATAKERINARCSLDEERILQDYNAFSTLSKRSIRNSSPKV